MCYSVNLFSALYDQNNEEMAGSGSGNIGSTESPSDIAKDDGSVTYGIDEDMRQNPDGHTEEPIHDDNLARIDHDVHKQTDDKSEVTGEGTDAPTNDSRLVESLKDVLNTANDINKNAKGDDSQSDIMAVRKELTVSEVREEETQDDNILRQYDYINSVQRNSFSDSDNKRTLMVQLVAKPAVEFTGDIQEKDSYANTDQNSDKTLDKEGSDVKVDIHQGYSIEDSVHFKSRDVMSAKLGEETKHKDEITGTDRNVIRKRRSLVHIIKAPLESRIE